MALGHLKLKADSAIVIATPASLGSVSGQQIVICVLLAAYSKVRFQMR